MILKRLVLPPLSFLTLLPITNYERPICCSRISIRHIRCAGIAVIALLCLSSIARAQTTTVTNSSSTPTPGVGRDYFNMLAETVDPANGTTSLRIGVPVPPGRQLTLPFSFNYDSNGVWVMTTNSLGDVFWTSYGVGYLDSVTSTFPAPGTTAGSGWSYAVPIAGHPSPDQHTVSYQVGGGHTDTVNCRYYTNWTFRDTSGGRHNLGLFTNTTKSNTHCQGFPETLGGGDLAFRASVPSGASLASQLLVSDSDGTVYSFSGTNGLASRIEDRNGNEINIQDLRNGAFTETDTVGRIALSSSGFGASGNTVTLSGISAPYTLTWGTVNFNFATTTSFVGGICSGTEQTKAQGSTSAVTSLELPNGTHYLFGYESTYGLLSSITYPSGALVTYAWGENDLSAGGTTSGCVFEYGKPAILHRYVSFNGSTTALQQDFQYSTTWSSTTGSWTSKQTIVTTHDLIRGTSFITTYVYSPSYSGEPLPEYAAAPSTFPDPQTPVEQTVTYGDFGGSTVETVNKNWLDAQQLQSASVTLGTLTSQVAYTYGSGNQLTEKDEYDFGASSPTRKTLITYQAFSNSATFPFAAIFDKPCKTVVTDGSGNPASETDYLYDGGTVVCGTSGASSVGSVSGLPSGTHDETYYFPTSTSPRGNATSVTHKCLQSCADAVTTYTYDETGQILSSKNPNGNTTSYSYLDSYTSGTPTGSTNAYLTKITRPVTNGVSHISTYSYGYADGELTVAKDENGESTAYTYGDSLDRLTGISYPDLGQTTYAYNDAVPSVSITKLATPNPTITSTSVMDGMGHLIQTQITSVSPPISAGTTYDGLGHIYTASNPHVSSGSSTDGTTTYTYDAIGRTTKVARPDGSTVNTTYSGNTVTVVDEAGHKRETVTDGLGRLQTVLEPDSSNNLTVQTSYTYDLLDNLLTATQAGSRARTYHYDSLSRLTSSTDPEISGTVSYLYDANDNLISKTGPAPNQVGSASYTASMTYDALDRMLTKTYTGGSPTATLSYTYDVTSVDGLTGLTNPIGRLVKDSAVSSAGTTSFYHDYDKLGRIADEWECVPLTCGSSSWHASYHYDYVGEVSSYSDAAFATYAQSFDGASRLTNITSTWPSGQPTTLATMNYYFPTGQIQEMTYGNGLAASYVFNSRLQPCRISFNSSAAVLTSCTAAIPSGNLVDFSYGYSAGTSDNGNLVSWSATGLQTFAHTYTYDQLNRVASMTGSGGACTALNWTYDTWGNRLSQSSPPGGGTCLQPQYTYLSNNQISGDGYDAAGNFVSQTGATYSYDNENRLVATAGSGGNATYVYDASGRRIAKTVGSATTYFALDKNSHVTAWLTSAGRQLGYAYASGQVLAQYQNGTTYFHHHDQLGSTRLVTSSNQSIQQCEGYYPFGELDINQCTPTAHNAFTDMRFTGKERDAESNLDYFGARYDSSTLGRFVTPDGPLVYQNRNDPQTLDLYSYVGNNPLAKLDPSGHLTIIVPGTDYDPSDWNQTMALVREAKSQFHDPNVYILPWTSDLGGAAIDKAAKEMSDYVDRYQFAPGEQLNVIAHSRGGDVALDATNTLDRPIDNLITLATPAYDNLPINSANIGTWINVRTVQDRVPGLVATMHPPTYFPGAVNLTLNAKGYGPVAAHTAIWNDKRLRDLWWSLWNTVAPCHEWFDGKTNTVHGCL
jgi:RHS repeat-associated protein